MKKKLVAVVLVIVALCAAYLWYANRAPQQINRTVDELLEAVAHKNISLQTPAEVEKSLEKILAAEIQVLGLSQMSSKPLARSKIVQKVHTFHRLSSLCRFEEESRALKIAGKKAQAYRTTMVKVAAGPRFKSEERWHLSFDLEKSDRWRITTIRAQKASEASSGN
mgnify:CR=1 FL=1